MHSPISSATMPSIASVFGGSLYPSQSGRASPVFNPATGEQIASVALCSKEEVSEAVKAAVAAQEDWGETPAAERARLMFRLRELLEDNKDRLALTISREHGKTHEDALGEVARGTEPVAFACGIAHLLKGEHSTNVARQVDTHSLRQPLGVCAGITPFNFPVMVPLWMIANAIACGNSFILKPSERDPSASLLLFELIEKAGFPKGVFSVVQGDKEAVDALLEHDDVKAISFVGSTPIAEYVYKTGCAHAKRVQALGGAKNHMVIMPDADLDKVCDALIGSAYGAAGERCMAISVAVPVGEAVADALVEKLSARVKQIRIAPSTDEKAEMGPLITQQHREKVLGYIESGIEEGAELVVDGRGFRLDGHEKGYFLGGCLFDRVSPSMKIYKEEIFGPVLVILRAASVDEAISLVNGHELGNGVSIFTRDGGIARNFSRRIGIGMVGINVPIPVPVGFHSFGGWKRSLFGSHGMYGLETVHFYTRLKTVTTRWDAGERGGAEFNFPKA